MLDSRVRVAMAGVEARSRFVVVGWIGESCRAVGAIRKGGPKGGPIALCLFLTL